MSFNEWPKYMVLPSNEDFARYRWEEELDVRQSCGVKGCAYGWLCTAFDEKVKAHGGTAVNKMPEESPAAEFARALINELPPTSCSDWENSPDTAEFAQNNPTLVELSDRFEFANRDFDVASAWKRAAQKCGYVVPAGVFR